MAAAAAIVSTAVVPPSMVVGPSSISPRRGSPAFSKETVFLELKLEASVELQALSRVNLRPSPEEATDFGESGTGSAATIKATASPLTAFGKFAISIDSEVALAGFVSDFEVMFRFTKPIRGCDEDMKIPLCLAGGMETNSVITLDTEARLQVLQVKGLFNRKS